MIMLNYINQDDIILKTDSSLKDFCKSPEKKPSVLDSNYRSPNILDKDSNYIDIYLKTIVDHRRQFLHSQIYQTFQITSMKRK